MSQYATAAQFKIWGLPVATIGGVADTTIDEFLQAASARADGCLRPLYSVPLGLPYPDDIAEAVCQIAALNMLRVVIGFNPENESDKSIKESAQEALRLLKAYGSGEMLLEQGGATAQVARPSISTGERRGF